MSSMFYRDALNALYSFGGIYAAGVLGWSIVQIGIFGILANLTGAIGAWLGGRADQAYGPKAVVSASILILTACCILVISTTRINVLFMTVAPGNHLPDVVFYAAGGLIGAAGGSIQAASRTLLVDQVEREQGYRSVRPLCAVRPGNELPRPACDRVRNRTVRLASLRALQPGRPALRRHTDHLPVLALGWCCCRL